MKKLFGEINLTWKRTVLFSILIAIYTALMALLPFTKDTSLRDIAINFEWWIFFGVLIIVNSKSPKDSALKCFVFFLISQPLIYLIQVPFSDKGFGLFHYYKYWFLWTILTLPMGYIGYRIKKSNVLSALILVPMFLLLAITGLDYFKEMCSSFPNHLLSFVACFAILLVVAFYVLKSNKLRILSIALTVVITAIFLLGSGKPQQINYEIHKELSEYNLVLSGEVAVTQFMGDSTGEAAIAYDEDGNCKLILTGVTDEKYSFVITDEENHEYSFEYQYTDEVGMELILVD